MGNNNSNGGVSPVVSVILFIGVAAVALSVYGVLTFDIGAPQSPDATAEAVGLEERETGGKNLFWEAGYERNDDIEEILVVNTKTGETTALQAPEASASVSSSEDYRVYVVTEGGYGSTERHFVAVIKGGELHWTADQ